MKKIILLFSPFFFLACGSDNTSTEVAKNDTTAVTEPAVPHLLCVFDANEQPAFINEKLDTVIPFGQYTHSFSDTIFELGFVTDTSGKILGLNETGDVLFEVYNYDNGPDYVQDGLFRIVRDGKIGYADEAGNIVIEPQFECAYAFENGKATVTIECEKIPDVEGSTLWESTEWYHIDTTGKTVE
jgi:hypothetical protein